MSGRRLAAGGGAIDRSKPLHFSFDGRAYDGFAGDTLASALLANGVSVVGRSFKYHRPRGLLAAGVEEPNALMQVVGGARTEVNLRATEVELYDGLTARAVNCWPHAAFDVGAVNGALGRFIPAGFYYKTLMWPNWHVFEPFIRRAAGLGRPSPEADPDAYESRYAHCDVLVVGAGPAGLAAALAAGRSGARVILCEQQASLGGSLVWDGGAVDGLDGPAWVAQTAAALAASPETEILTRTTACGYSDHNALTLVERLDSAETLADGAPRMRLWQVRAGRVILATGALERPLVFPGNDRPGVMLASAVREYLGRYGVRAGDRAMVFTNNDDGYATARALIAAGGQVSAVIDSRPNPAAALREGLAAPVLAGAVVISTRGYPALTAVKLREASGAERWIDADLLAMSGGFNPTIHLFRQSGGQLAWDADCAAFRPGRSVQAEESVGAAAGVWGLAEGLEAGHGAGERAAAAAGSPAAPTPAPHGEASPGRQGLAIEPLWIVDAPGKAFVDFQNDVSTGDIALSPRENFVSVEHLKRYTTLGMAPDQGKTSNVNALAIMAGLTGRTIAETGTTLYRFPFTPIPFAVMAGRNRGELFKPIRRVPAHARHVAAGAAFQDYGGWLRPAYYARPGETPRAAEQREARAVRERVGLFDGSPLGKIEVVGPDAAAFLDRIYANTVSTLKVGKARYGLMLNELGVVIDDGVTLRLADDRFLVGTTSAGAARIAAWLEEWLQCEWPHLQVLVAPVTTDWAVLALSGPKARAVLEAAGCDGPIGPDALPHMSFCEARVAGIAARIVRVSFTGEASFEINVATGQATALFDRLLQAGQAHGVELVGMDAWMLLRTEKGYLHIGADTDGTTSPDDIGWERVRRRKVDFIGRRSLTRPDNLRTDRLQFVGLELLDAGGPPPVGSHLRGLKVTEGSEGYVTSAGFSPTLGRGVALAMVRAGQARMGEIVAIATPGGVARARIAQPCAYDPEGARLNG
jgi:sarcosine oxidase subunit alpha